MKTKEGVSISKNQVRDGDKLNKKHPKKDYLVCGDERVKNEYGFCTQRAGWGTDHLGIGRCKLHGGKSTGPRDQKRNKNAVKTGEYETIWLDCLDDEEKEMWVKIRTEAADQLNEEIKLTTIRERRMMKRIQNLKESQFTTVERKEKSGIGPEGPVDVTEEKERATLGQIQDIEEALTRVQSRKARLLNIKHKVEKGEGPVEVNIDNYISAINNSAKEVWEDEE